MMARTRTRTIMCGEGQRGLIPGEGPCVSRFRDRRLLAFLFLQGYQSTFRALLYQTVDFFSVEHLESLVSQGHWIEAMRYVSPRFLWLESRLAPPQSVEAHVLVYFLRVHFTVAKIVSGTEEGASLAAKFTPFLCSNKVIRPSTVRLRSILSNVLYSRQVRASLDWGRVRSIASVMVRDLVNKTPELKELLLLPDGPMGPQNVHPIGFGFASFRRRNHVKKRARRPQPSAIAKLYLDKKRSLPSSSHCSQVLSTTEFDIKVWGWLTDLIEECFKASKCPELYQGCPLQSSAKQGAPVATVPQTLFGNVTNRPKNSGIPSVTDTGAVAAGNVIDPKDSSVSSVTDAGAPVAPVPQTMFGHVTNPPKHSGIPSVTDIGAADVGNVADPKDTLAPSVTDTGTSEEGHPRTNPGTELTTIEDFLDTKRRRATGAFGEANMHEVVGLQPRLVDPKPLAD